VELCGFKVAKRKQFGDAEMCLGVKFGLAVSPIYFWYKLRSLATFASDDERPQPLASVSICSFSDSIDSTNTLGTQTTVSHKGQGSQ
jgi:hypothetical protein